MNNENYIVINGKKTELTEEQIKKLGIELPSNPFNRVNEFKCYYYIERNDVVGYTRDDGTTIDNTHFDNTNYFNNEDFATQVMLHQQLYRKLLKYAYDNDAEVTEEDWGNRNPKYFIYCELHHNTFHVDSEVGDTARMKNFGAVYFINPTVAENAIRDVIKPFMKEHPEFVW